MSTRSTNNASLLFVTRRPAWEVPVRLKQSLSSTIDTSRSGLEQRQARQSKSRWVLQYTAILTRAEADARLVRAQGEIASPLIVPIWPMRASLAANITSNATVLSRNMCADFFAPGDYVLLSSVDLGDQFRQVATRAGTAITLVPDGGGLAYLSGATVWPCRACVRDKGTAAFVGPSDDSTQEALNYVTL